MLQSQQVAHCPRSSDECKSAWSLPPCLTFRWVDLVFKRDKGGEAQNDRGQVTENISEATFLEQNDDEFGKLELETRASVRPYLG